MPQMYGLRSTLLSRRESRDGGSVEASPEAAFLAAASADGGGGASTGGKPTDSGESRTARSSRAPTTRPTAPGAHMPHCHPNARAAEPASTGAANPPRLWAMFHMPQYVPRSLVANQEVSMRAQQGPPKPCRMPLSAQKQQNQVMEVPKPNAMFTAAVAISPPASMMVGEVRAPRTPDTNLEKPYAMGKREVSAPTRVMSMPRAGSATMTGAV